MNSKTSFFSKSLFKSDIKRFWWLCLLETLILIFACVVPVYERCTRYIGYYSNYTPTWMDGAIAVIFAFAIGVSILLFSYLHGNSSVSGYHCLPIKRKSLFATKILSGAAITAAPIVLCGIIFACMLTNPAMREHYRIIDTVKWTVSGVMYTAILFSLTALVNQFTGNPIGTLVFTAGFLVLPMIIWGFFDEFFREQLYGYVHYSGNAMKYIYADESTVMSFSGFTLYAALTVIFTVCAHFLYKKRKLEVHGEVIAFSWLKPVFIGIVGMLSSMLSYVYFSGTLRLHSIWVLIPLGILGTAIAHMISRKSLSLKGIFKPVSVYLAAALCFCCVVEFDLTGFETRIPDPEDVESAVITYPHNKHYFNFGSYELTYTLPGQIEPKFTQEADIKNVIALHEHCINNRNKLIHDRSIPIEYTLKNGRVLKRTYNISYTKDAEVLKPLYETKEMRADLYPLADGGHREFTSVVIHDRRIKDTISLYPDNENMNRIIEAIKADLAVLPYEEMTVNTGSSVNIQVGYKNNYAYSTEPADDFDKDNVANDSSSYAIRPSYKNTVTVLTELGFYSSLPKAEDLEGATISVWRDGNPDNPVSAKELDIDMQKAKQNAVSVTDSEEIKNLYALYDSMIESRKFTDYNNRLNISISYRVRNTGHVFEVSCSYDADKIPDVLKKYFEDK